MKEQRDSSRVWPVSQPVTCFILSLDLPQLGLRHWAEGCSPPSAGRTVGLPSTPGPSPFHLIYYAIDHSFLPLFCTCVQVCEWVCTWVWVCVCMCGHGHVCGCVRGYGCGYGCVGVWMCAWVERPEPGSRHLSLVCSTLFSERKALTGLRAHYFWLEFSSHRVGGGSYCLLAQCWDHWRLQPHSVFMGV